MAETISIVNWEKYQHYKHANPRWIKLYNDLLTCYEYQSIQDSDARGLLFTLYMMGGRHQNKIPLDIEYIQRIGSLPFKLKQEHLQILVNAGFITISITPIEEVYNCSIQSVAQSRVEKSRVEKSIYSSSPAVMDVGFDAFWKSYPRKIGKGAARKSWDKIKPSESLLAKIIFAVEQQKKSADWQKENGKYIPHPTTWLNQERWDDEVQLSAIEEWKLKKGITSEGCVA